MGSDDDKAAVSRTDSAEKEGSELEKDEESGEEDSDLESDEEAAGEEEEKMAFVPSEDDEAPEALDQLQQFVSGLDVTSKKRKVPEDSSAAPNAEARARRRRLTKERTEAGDENEFRAHSSGRQYFWTGNVLSLQNIL
jgi:U3 small nucleolar RNA-associated protein 14